jgi:hypothetical protein
VRVWIAVENSECRNHAKCVALMDSKARPEVLPSATGGSATRKPRRNRRGLAWLGGFLAKAFSRPAAESRTRTGQLSFEALEPRILLDATPSIPVTRIDGSIDVAGETDRYGFTLNETVRVVFDSLTDDASMRWSLEGPRGMVVSERGFNVSDSAERSGDVALDLAAGDYTLSVDGVADNTGAYSFRLIDIAQAQELTLGTTVNGQLDPANETDAYRFSVAAGQRFFIDRFANTGDIYWRLLDPYGRTVVDRTHMNNDLGEMTLAIDGSYTLLIEGRAYTTGSASYSFNVALLDEAVPQLMTLGTLVAGRIAQAGQRDIHSFTLATDRRVVFDSLTADDRLLWSLTGPNGTLLADRQFQYSDSYELAGNTSILLRAGSYTLVVDGQGDRVGDYAFRLLDLALAQVMAVNTTVIGSLSDAGTGGGTPGSAPATETRLYKFAALAGERFFVDAEDLSGDNFSLRIFDPKGGLVAGPQAFTNDVDVFTAAYDGDYVLALEGRIYNTRSSDYQFKVQRVVDGSAPLTLDSRVDGSLDHPGQRQAYTFTLAAPMQLLFDSLTYNNNFNWSLVGARGSEVAGRSFVYSDSAEYGGNPLLTLAAGGYTLTVDGNLDAVGAYAFRLLNLTTASSVVAYDSEVSGRLSPGSMTSVYKLTASAGDEVLFDHLALSGGSPYWRLLDETGFQVFGPEAFADRASTSLRLGGSYYLLLEGRSWESGAIDYRFQLALQGNTPLTALTGTSITLGATVNGTLSAAGELDDYVFDVAGPARLYFDSFAPSNSGAFFWSLLGPRGIEIADRSTYSSESYEFGNGNPVIAVSLAGRYQIRIRGAGNTTGNYSFRVLNLADGVALTPGTPVTASLDPGNETDVYRFAANAGDRVFFDRQTFSPAYSGWVSWRLLDPYGGQVWGPANFYDDVDVSTLAFAGVYTLLIEGRIWTRDSVARFDYSFNIQPVVDDPASALTIGDTVDGNIAHSGQQNSYSFSLADETLLYFDSLSNSNIAWTLRGPDGYLLSRNLQNSDSAELGQSNPLLRLAAGDYTLTLDGVGDITGDYSFRLVDVANEAAALIPGTAVSDSLSGARVTDFYRFDAVAGERYYFDRISYGDYYNTTYRLIDPQGNQLWGGYVWPEDQEMSAFALSGTYYLLVEGRIGNAAASNAYSFNLHKVVDISDSLTLGQTASGSFTAPGQRASYHFTLGEARRLLFDGLTPNNANPDIYWTLTGPRGTEISNRRFYGSESHELGTTSPLLDLLAGDYTLTLDPQSDQIGDFSFRLLDIAAATAFTSNRVVSGQLDPANETDVYRFNAIAGTRYYIDRQTLSSGADRLSWRLFDPYGRQIFGPYNLDDVDIFTLSENGAYTLLVEGRIWQTQYSATIDYSFKLLEITDDVVDIVPGVSHGVDQFSTDGQLGGALNVNGLRYAQVANNADLDQTGSLTLEAWFKVDAYAGTWQALFYKGNGNSNQRTYTLWLNSAGYLHLSTGNNTNNNINTAAGSVRTGQWYHVAVVLDRDSPTGVMKIYLDGVEAASGALAKTSASSNANPLLIGSSLENYPVFQGAVDEVRLWNSVRSAQQIADNKDQALVGNEAGLLMYLKADESSGTTLADASGRGNAGQIVHPWASTPGVVAGRIDFGQQDYYRFTLGATTRLYFDSLTDNHNLRWYLSGPRGTLVSDRPFQSSDSQNGLSVFDLVAGDYTLRVDGVGDTTGDYGFRLLDLAGALELDFNTVVNGQHTPATATTAYRFTAEAGERLYFDEVSASGGYPYWRLLDPWGRSLWGPNYLPSDDVQLQILPFAGVYTLLVEGRRDGGNGTSNFSFRVQQVRDLTQAITLDGVYGMPAPWANGQFGDALYFNGLQSAQIDHDATLDLSNTLTLETWVKVDRFDNTWTNLFYKGNPENPGERTYSLWLHANGTVAFDTGDGSNQSTQTDSGLITTGQWHHIAAVMDRTAGIVRILVDGVLQKSATNIRKNPASSNSRPLYLGSAVEPGTSYASLVGSMDDIRVWNVARSDAEILASMNAPLVGNAAGLVAYIKADPG